MKKLTERVRHADPSMSGADVAALDGAGATASAGGMINSASKSYPWMNKEESDIMDEIERLCQQVEAEGRGSSAPILILDPDRKAQNLLNKFSMNINDVQSNRLTDEYKYKGHPIIFHTVPSIAVSTDIVTSVTPSTSNTITGPIFNDDTITTTSPWVGGVYNPITGGSWTPADANSFTPHRKDGALRGCKKRCAQKGI